MNSDNSRYNFRITSQPGDGRVAWPEPRHEPAPEPLPLKIPALIFMLALLPWLPDIYRWGARLAVSEVGQIFFVSMVVGLIVGLAAR